MQYTHAASLPISPSIRLCLSLPLSSLSLCVCLSLCLYLFLILFLSVCLSLYIIPPPSLPFFFPFHLQTEAANKYSNMRGLHQKTNTHTLMIRKMQIYVQAARKFTASSFFFFLFPAQLHQIKQHLRLLSWSPYMDATNDLACITSAIQFVHSGAVAAHPVWLRVSVLRYGN